MLAYSREGIKVKFAEQLDVPLEDNTLNIVQGVKRETSRYVYLDYYCQIDPKFLTRVEINAGRNPTNSPSPTNIHDLYCTDIISVQNKILHESITRPNRQPHLPSKQTFGKHKKFH